MGFHAQSADGEGDRPLGVRAVRRNRATASRGRTPPALYQLVGFDRPGTRTAVPSSIKAHDRLFGQRTSIQGVNPRGEAVSSRMAGAPAQEEIDEPTDKFLRPRSHIAHLELLA